MIYLPASPAQAWLWHQRISHLNFDTINLLSNKDIVNGLPKLKYVKDQLCSSCELGKAKRSSFKTKTVPSSKVRLKLLHMDLCGPMLAQIRITSLTGFPARSVRSSNAIALDSSYLLVRIIETSQSRQHESRKSPTTELFDDDSGRISIHHYEY
ncbi:retrovirus-related pol polyprotein from transposon TNT 1-94 [Tanacetum coccineum]